MKHLMQSERIYLRPLRKSDAQKVFEYRADPSIYQFQTWHPATLAEVEEFISTQIAEEPNLPGTWFQLAICKSDNDALIGDCGLHFLAGEQEQVEIGITIRREYQGHGYGRETLESVFSYVFDDLNKHRIVASVDPGNTSSIRLLERMKMRQEGYFKESIWHDGRWLDDVFFAILAHEWKPEQL
jgi:RimJ/RimL family protein N-acetyltransferase